MKTAIIRVIDNLIAKFRIGSWESPKLFCEICGRTVDRKIVHHTGDGWLVAWECPNYCGWEELYIMKWPFFRDYVFAKDWEFLGFEVV